jgi:O-antigen ligase
MFQANPIFGWGLDSYEKLLPFFASDLMLGHRAERAVSDVLQLLVEFGLLGLAATLAFLAIFSVRYLRIQHDIRLTKQMLLGCAAVLILSIFDSPFMSPAVFYSFFVIFFSAMRWADLSRNKADEVDAQKPQLVTPESMRNVLFFTKPYHEKEK